MQSLDLASSKMATCMKNIQFKCVKFIVKYPFLVIVMSVLVSIIISTVGQYLSPIKSLSIPYKELSTIGTPFSNRRSIKQKLKQMIQNKQLYQVDDYIKYFEEAESIPNQYANFSTKDEKNYSDEIIDRIAKAISSSFVENQKFKRQIRDFEIDSEQDLGKSDAEIFEKSRSTFISCNSVFNVHFIPVNR
ncbi:hypothetical protein BpHYR1_037207 [Brachionus plicatilis]|uniref:Uncharacterized protein n=1 Tax=Brachionus plicatilis TaxID=10195 RepID=A0A3M7QSG4_BRAPC|nr:hypothetical protein BpHYR1_037207 [Brachionus plicatilis]